MALTTQLNLFGDHEVAVAPTVDGAAFTPRPQAAPLEHDERERPNTEPPPVMDAGTHVPGAPSAPSAAAPAPMPGAAPSPLMCAVERERSRVAQALLARIGSVAAHNAAQIGAQPLETTMLLVLPLSDAQLDLAAHDLLRSAAFWAAVDLLCLHIVPHNDRSSTRHRESSARPQRSAAASNAARHTQPSVGEVVLFGDRPQWYALPAMQRVRCIYATPTTIRVSMPDGQERTVPQQQATALPDGDVEAWERLDTAYRAYAAALTELANALCALGYYSQRLRAACRAGDDQPIDDRLLRMAPNPLSSTVVLAPVPPGVPQAPAAVVWQPWAVPAISRRTLRRHTPKQLVLCDGDAGTETHTSQGEAFCCADDAAWRQITVLRDAAENRRSALATMLTGLGTYAAAANRQDREELPRADAAVPVAGGVGVSPVPTDEATPRDVLLPAPTDPSK